MNLSGMLRALTTTLLDICYPPHCLVCGQALNCYKDLLCAACWEPLHFSAPCRCYRCSNPLEVSASTCINCATWQPTFKQLWILAPFTEVMQRCVHLLKFRRERLLGEALGAALAQVPEFKQSLAQVDALVPVPLHPARQRERGYNQSEDIARGLACQLGIPLYTDLLVRCYPTRQQAKLSVEARRQNMQHAFAVIRSVPSSQRLCLVDDVVTTGMTLEACAQVLLKAGGQVPWGAALSAPFLH